MSLMLDEIREQPRVLERMLSDPPSGLSRLGRRYSRHRPPLIILVARGTSDNAALFGRYLFEITLGIPTSLAAPSVATLYRKRPVPKDALVIGISQSGESTDINTYLEAAKASGSFTVGITNEQSSALASLVDEVLPTSAGKEMSVAATKTYTAQLLMIYSVARTLGAAIAHRDLLLLPESVDGQLRNERQAKSMASTFQGISRAAVVGRGLNYANGLEFALKLTETSYVVAAGYSCADFSHGPIAMVEEDFPVFVFVPPGPTYGETAKLVERLGSRSVDIICIGTASEVRALPRSRWLEVRASPPKAETYAEDILTPIPSIIPAQLFAAHLAEVKGLNPDKPRMLSKVTQTL